MIVFISSGFSSFAQIEKEINTKDQANDTIFLTYQIPIRAGFIIKTSENCCSCSNMKGVYIFNHKECDSAYAIADGIITNVLNLGDELYCIIRSGSRVIAYGPFSCVNPSKGDLIVRGAFIGKMNNDEDDKYSLFILMNNEEKYPAFNEYVSFLNKL